MRLDYIVLIFGITMVLLAISTIGLLIYFLRNMRKEVINTQMKIRQEVIDELTMIHATLITSERTDVSEGCED